MRRLPLILLLTLLLAPALALADQHVYKWTDAQGTVHFSDTLPPRGTAYEIVDSADIPAGSSSTDATAQAEDGNSEVPPVSADQSDFDTETTGTNVKRQCKRISTNIDTLNNKAPVSYTTVDGKTQLMTAERRAKELERAQAQYDQYCTPQGGA